jgi:mannose-6-phosphate isomerase-like protein (cupin superfamily)
MPSATHRRAAALPAFRISPKDSNKLAIVADAADGVGFTAVIEVFEPGGSTPPNRHEAAHELFYVISGTGRATCDGTTIEVGPGDSLLLHPGHDHTLENTGAVPLVCFTVMVPNEGFSELIRAGVPAALDRAELTAIGARP